MSSGGELALGIDIGGTFTDVVVAGPDGLRAVVKRLTTPDDPARAAIDATLAAIAEAGADPADLGRVVHGTTLATNTILEGHVSRVAFITTRGFRSLLQLGRHARVEEERFDLGFDPPPPAVDALLTFELHERIGPAGSIEVPLDHAQVESVASTLSSSDIDAVAVCLLHSYANPTHERAAGEILRRRLAVDVVLSCDVWPEMREYERSTTTAMSAFVGPVMASYVSELEARLRDLGIGAPLYIMESAGGVMSAALARARAVATIESGPAAGVIAAKVVGAQRGYADVIAFDMGGTTAKAALVTAGEPATTNQFQVGGKGSFGTRRSGTGVPIKTRTIDLAEVGAGGGSIAWVDEHGTLLVGPRSAGAKPGPACYGLGGTHATVTDASVVLGYLDPSGFAEQGLRFDPSLAYNAVARELAEPLGVSPERAALAVHEVANATMAGAIHVVTVQRGVDPRRYALVTSGGAGPLHAARIAERFGITTVIVPPACGVASALGLLTSDLRSDRMRSVYLGPSDVESAAIEAHVHALDADALDEIGGPGAAGGVAFRRWAGVRYQGQTHELDVPLGSQPADRTSAAIRSAFERVHHETFGATSGAPIEVVRLRVAATLPVTHPAFRRSRDRREGASVRTRVVWIGGRPYDAPVHRVGSVGDAATRGPALFESPESTVLVPPGWVAEVTDDGGIVLRQDGRDE